ncbi:MAG: uracil-DNA glycosylase [Desulfotignum sp.]|nr:uracil-DNA glycosylase [Desulfotignum sp.]
MTSFDTIHSSAKSVNFSDIIHDLVGYLEYQKQTGVVQIPLSDHSLERLAAWGHPLQPRKPFIHMGPESANVVLVDGNGTFFEGEAGALLKKILKAMKLPEDTVCLCNAPNAKQVLDFLQSVRPVVVIALGATAVRVVTGSRDSLADIRGEFFKIQGISVMPTFHPAELLKDPGLKRPVWEDMQQVMQINGIAP